MLELVPPYRAQQLEEFAENVDGQPKPGYPEHADRLFMDDGQITQAYQPYGIFRVPMGHDALDSPNRASAPEEVKAQMDPEIQTGTCAMLSSERTAQFRKQRHILDQHGRPIHPGFRQLLKLTASDGRRLGMPTGIGQFYRYGGNGVADGMPFRTGNGGHQEVLLIHRPNAGWATPGGYEEQKDFNNEFSETSVHAAARRNVFEETGIALRGAGRIAARMMPISSVHTLNAWSKTHAVAFPVEDEAYLHDVEPRPGSRVDGVAWLRVRDVLGGAVRMWSTDHVRYIEEAHKIRRESIAS